MKILIRIGILMGLILFAVGITSVFAFDCPNIHKPVMEYYKKTAKVPGVDQAKLMQAKNTLDDAMKKHEAGNHRASMDEMADTMKLITAAPP